MQMEPGVGVGVGGRPFSGVCGPAASQWTVVASTESTTPTASEQGGTLPLYSRRERGRH